VNGTKSPGVVSLQVDSITNLRVNFVASYCTEKGLNQPFSDFQQMAMRYLGASDLAAYRRISKLYNPDSIPDETKAFDKVMMKVPTNNTELIYNEFYQSFIRQLSAGNIASKIQLQSPDQLPEYYMLQFDEILNLVANQEGRNYLLKELVVEAIKETGSRDINALVKKFYAICDNEPMEKRVEKVWLPYKNMQVGMPCPPIECFKPDGEKVMLSSLIGKVVYIDVWATWCGPCKKEIPMLKQLESQYHGKNIEFVSISTDQDLEKWKSFVVAEQLGGLQLHQSDNIDLSISKNFVVNSIPRFILLDKEGKIVSADAPRPSSGQTITALIDQLLIP
jgi:thiol-disulfide isomerase/thioredoxin